MTRGTVIVDHERYEVSGLEPRARGDIFQAVVSAQLVDALTGAPVTVPTQISSTAPGLFARVASGGFVGLVGTPTRALPGLATTPYLVDVRINADGYLPVARTVPFAAQVGFPASFAPADLGVLDLVPVPVTLSVATYNIDPATNRPRPLPGATVRITGHWDRLTDLAAPPSVGALLAVAPRLSGEWAAGADIDLPALATPAEPPRTLARPASAGDTALNVSRRGGFTTTDLAGVGLADPDRAERVAVRLIDGTSDPDGPVILHLHYPLCVDHAEGTDVTRIVPTPGATVTTLTSDTGIGGATLSAASLAGLTAGQVIRISQGTADPEYRAIAMYEFTSNGEGLGRFPPLSGVAVVAVGATSGPLSATDRATLAATPATLPSFALDLTLT